MIKIKVDGGQALQILVVKMRRVIFNKGLQPHLRISNIIFI
jgi:hypothetical protein